MMGNTPNLLALLTSSLLCPEENLTNSPATHREAQSKRGNKVTVSAESMILTGEHNPHLLLSPTHTCSALLSPQYFPVWLMDNSERPI
jgi:hypothetical protein